jgi:hypothetical protein
MEYRSRRTARANDIFNLIPGRVPEVTFVHMILAGGYFSRSPLSCMGNTPQVDRIHSDKIRITAWLSSALVKNVAGKSKYIIFGRENEDGWNYTILLQGKSWIT